MMAIGIYSFLDNLLAHIPTRSDIDIGPAQNSTNRETSLNDQENVGLRSNVSDVAVIDTGLRTDLSADRQERVRWIPHFSTWTIHEGVPVRENGVTESDLMNVTASQLNDEPLEPLDPLEPPAKIEVAPGGYPEEIFIYLSDREKLDYMCSIW
ncbi:unnamed protein product [Echinostoma caproni]|uniref:Peptidase A1 domain-containing protein n=1 Tax=Echinostoma caproni TaxID=27848 RepID=A0A183AGX0_9TREM|nr:unnamed protein product [Echinostoma caproni]